MNVAAETFVVSALLLAAVPRAQQTLPVAPAQPSTIQAAVDASPPGGTIAVQAIFATDRSRFPVSHAPTIRTAPPTDIDR